MRAFPHQEEQQMTLNELFKNTTYDDTGENVLDRHGHLIVDHDLYSHDGLTPDGIAEAFIEFAKKEGLSFFR